MESKLKLNTIALTVQTIVTASKQIRHWITMDDKNYPNHPQRVLADSNFSTIGMTADVISAVTKDAHSWLLENVSVESKNETQTYLDDSVDLYDLEYRMRQLDKHVSERRS